MEKKTVLVAAVTVVLLSMSMSLFAHHGTSVFDTSKTLTMKGNVTEWDWSNPHCLPQVGRRRPSSLGMKLPSLCCLPRMAGHSDESIKLCFPMARR